MTDVQPDQGCEVRQVFRRVHFLGMAFVYFLLVLYGSLVPFTYHPVPWDELLRRCSEIPHLPLSLESRSDWAANILLFIPLSYLAMASICADRSRWVAWFTAMLMVPACGMLSAMIEMGQVVFPLRTVSLNDVVAESSGAVIGVTLWVTQGQALTDWMRKLWQERTAPGLVASLLPAYIVLLVLIHMMPFDLTISLRELYRQWSHGRIHLVPFDTFADDPVNGLRQALWTIGFFAPVGVLYALSPVTQGRHPKTIWQIAMRGLAIATAIEVLQVFVLERHLDATDVVTGTIGVLLGWGVANRSAGRRAADELKQESEASAKRDEVRRRVVRLSLVAVWLGLIAVSHWSPFGFHWSLDVFSDQIDRIEWILFTDYYWQSEYDSFTQLLEKTSLFGVLGGLVAICLRPDVRWGGIIGAVVFVVGAAVVFELGQLLLPSRYPSISDILIEGVSGAAAVVIACRWRRKWHVAPSRSHQGAR